jgi:rod shape-determining protein MreB
MEQLSDAKVAEKGSASRFSDPATRSGILYVGMDLGCYKTSIAATNGTREVVYSIVGWPRDPVSRKMLGKDVVFGNEAFQHRLALDTVRPFEKGALKYVGDEESGIPKEKLEKYKQAARELVKHVVSLTRPPKGTLVYGVIGAPARASILNKQALIDSCRGTFEAVMIVSEPFAVAYGMNQLEDALVVDLGAGTTDLCRMHGAIPSEEDQFTIS